MNHLDAFRMDLHEQYHHVPQVSNVWILQCNTLTSVVNIYAYPFDLEK